MSLNRLKASAGARKKKKLLGRGPGTGHGKTSTRGHKGQKSRSGRGHYLGFEGGQSPLIRRIPKRGFFHKPKKEYQIVNIESLSIFSKDTVVDPKALQEKNLIKMQLGLVKILGNGKLNKALVVKAHKFSGSALKMIEALGGKIEIIK